MDKGNILALFSWSIGYGEETSPSHPDGMLRKRPLSWSIGYGEATSPSHPDGMLRKRPLFPLSKGPLQGANYLIINY